LILRSGHPDPSLHRPNIRLELVSDGVHRQRHAGSAEILCVGQQYGSTPTQSTPRAGAASLCYVIRMPARFLGAKSRSGGIDRPSRDRLCLEHLAARLGRNEALALRLKHDGQKLPSKERVLRYLRQQAVVDECVNRGLSIAEAAAKFRLSVPHVKRILGRHLRQQREP
jgi:hypothetical protein